MNMYEVNIGGYVEADSHSFVTSAFLDDWPLFVKLCAQGVRANEMNS